MSIKNKKKKKKKLVNNNEIGDSSFSTFEVVIIIIISVVFGMITGYVITYGNSTLSVIRSHSGLLEISKAYGNILDNYYGEVDEDELSKGAIKGMLSVLEDPYTQFLDETTTDEFNESVSGTYVGIGISTEFVDNYNKIISIVDGGPGDKAGLKVGDFIIKVDNIDCSNMLPGELTDIITGEIGSSLSITIRRDGKEKNIQITREIIEVQNVIGKIIDDNIGYIQIKLFSANSYKQFSSLLDNYSEMGITSLIIDLRNNPGGHLLQTKEILELFFNKKTVLYQLEDNNKIVKVTSSKNNKVTIPVVLLINNSTASSAEVFVACFKDNYSNVTIVGTNSYGKDSVQKTLTLNSGSSIKFTTQKWYTPKGSSVADTGIDPDRIVIQDSKYYASYSDLDDSQLQEAINILNKK